MNQIMSVNFNQSLYAKSWNVRATCRSGKHCEGLVLSWVSVRRGEGGRKTSE